MSDASLQNYYSFAKKLAYKAGEIMLQHFQIGIEQAMKANNTPVTIADTTINRLVIEEVKKSYPTHGVIGEEESYERKDAEYVWVCDPLDGTVPYTFGIPISMFSLALVKDGQPLLGVLYDPYTKRLYHAIKSQGAYYNDKTLSVNKQATFPMHYIGLPSRPTQCLDASKLCSAVMEKQAKIFMVNCISQSSSLVASGQLFASLFAEKTAHDIAAIKIIVEEAGGKVTNLRGEEQRYDQPIFGAIISNGILHEELVSLIKPFIL
jgi:myo-inositol-1(or 4)-monophosphatase